MVRFDTLSYLIIDANGNIWNCLYRICSAFWHIIENNDIIKI